MSTRPLTTDQSIHLMIDPYSHSSILRLLFIPQFATQGRGGSLSQEPAGRECAAIVCCKQSFRLLVAGAHELGSTRMNEFVDAYLRRGGTQLTESDCKNEGLEKEIETSGSHTYNIYNHGVILFLDCVKCMSD